MGLAAFEHGDRVADNDVAKQPTQAYNDSMHPYETRRRRRTGTEVTVCHGADEGLDTSDPAGAWYTICEHGTLIAHATLALARSHAPEPDQWCEECSATALPNES